MRPGNPPPSVTEIKLARTAKDIMPGIDAGLNQLFARIDGELSIKTLPIAAKTDPNRHQKIFPTSSSVLIQTPAMRRAPPIQHPIFMPNLSRIQLAGKAKIGCRMGKNSVLRVTRI